MQSSNFVNYHMQKLHIIGLKFTIVEIYDKFIEKNFAVTNDGNPILYT